MNLPNRSVSSRTLVAFVLATAITIWAGFVVRRRLFKRSADALPVSVGEALTRWKEAHFVGFGNAMSIAILGAILKFLGSSWYVAGFLFGLSLGLLFLWDPARWPPTVLNLHGGGSFEGGVILFLCDMVLPLDVECGNS